MGAHGLAALHTRSGDSEWRSPQTFAGAGRSPLGSRSNGTKNVKVLCLTAVGEGVARELGAVVAVGRLGMSILVRVMNTRLVAGS